MADNQISIIDLTAGGNTLGGHYIPANPFAGRTRSQPITGLVFHHSGGDGLAGAMTAGQQAGIQHGTGAQFYIDRDGSIYRYAADSDVMSNIQGPSNPHRTDAVGSPSRILANQNVLGVEVIASDSNHFTAAQKAAAASLALYVSQTYGVTPDHIVGHGELQGGPGGNKMADEGNVLAQIGRTEVASKLPPMAVPQVATATANTGLGFAPQPANPSPALQAIRQISDLQRNASLYQFGGPTRAYADGLMTPGNIDLNRRPMVKMPDGTIATVRTISFNDSGVEVLIPTVSSAGRIMSDQQAIGRYYGTGEHMGKYVSVDAANAAAEKIHQQQAVIYGLVSGSPDERDARNGNPANPVPTGAVQGHTVASAKPAVTPADVLEHPMAVTGKPAQGAIQGHTVASRAPGPDESTKTNRQYPPGPAPVEATKVDRQIAPHAVESTKVGRSAATLYAGMVAAQGNTPTPQVIDQIAAMRTAAKAAAVPPPAPVVPQGAMQGHTVASAKPPTYVTADNYSPNPAAPLGRFVAPPQGAVQGHTVASAKPPTYVTSAEFSPNPVVPPGRFMAPSVATPPVQILEDRATRAGFTPPPAVAPVAPVPAVRQTAAHEAPVVTPRPAAPVIEMSGHANPRSGVEYTQAQWSAVQGNQQHAGESIATTGHAKTDPMLGRIVQTTEYNIAKQAVLSTAASLPGMLSGVGSFLQQAAKSAPEPVVRQVTAKIDPIGKAPDFADLANFKAPQILEDRATRARATDIPKPLTATPTTSKSGGFIQAVEDTPVPVLIRPTPQRVAPLTAPVIPANANGVVGTTQQQLDAPQTSVDASFFGQRSTAAQISRQLNANTIGRTNPAAASAIARGQSSYVSDGGALLPTISTGGTIRQSYGDSANGLGNSLASRGD